jgi:uncharacterized cupredoxin-like copper-binding protein
MIRLFVLVGIAGGVLITYLAVFAVAPESQLAPAVSLLVKFEADGVVPKANAIVENEEMEHGIFDVPAEDARQLEMAMSMSGMSMGSDSTETMPMSDEGKTAIDMGSGGTDTTKDGASMDASMNAGMNGGLEFSEEGAVDREIELTMAEWRFSNKSIAVERGERIRFNITNGGKIPHEFMFMTMPAMTAINYRATRADWSLLEHKALYEKSLVLPGGSFSFVAEIKQDGAWMFMCMLPYHMQMGMMGVMNTAGADTTMQMN